MTDNNGQLSLQFHKLLFMIVLLHFVYGLPYFKCIFLSFKIT